MVLNFQIGSQIWKNYIVRWILIQLRKRENIIILAKERIQEVKATVDEAMLERVWQEFNYRVDICRVTHGSHTESL
jgi:hypothetical protein